MKRHPIALVLLLAACAGGAHPAPTVAAPAAPPAAAPAVADPQVPLDPRIKTGTLPNGLRYFILPHQKPEKRVYLWLAVNAGSVQEDEDQRGLAHFVEHMSFNGTEHFPKNDIINYIEKIGMRFGADLNAYTSFDETVYQLEVPTDDPALVSKGLGILREWAGRDTIDPAEVDKERGVVLEEWRLGRGARARVFDKQAPVLFKDTRYAERLTIGKPEIIKGAPRDALARFYKDWYRPNLMAVLVVGDIKPEEIEPQIKARFADLANPAKERTRPAGGMPPVNGTRVSVVSDAELPVSAVMLVNMLPHRRNSTRGDYRRLLGEGLFHTMMNQRLGELGQKPDAPYVFASSGTSSETRDSDAFTRVGVAKQGKVKETLTALLTEATRVERHGFTPAELERAKQRLLRNAEQRATETDKADGRALVSELSRYFLTGEQMPGAVVEAQLARELLPTFTLDEVNHTARQWGGAESRVVMIAGPEKITPPSEADVLAWVKEVDGAKIDPWQEEQLGQKLMAQAPSPGKVVAEKQVAEIGVTEWTLSNGARVVLKPTDFENDRVAMAAFSPGGTSQAKDADYPSAHYADEIVGVSGLGEFRQSDLVKLLSGKVVRLQPNISELEESVGGSSSAADLETLFQLVYLTFTAPHRDAEAFAAWKSRAEETLRDRRAQPEQAFAEDMQVFVSQNHLRRRPATVEELAKVDVDKAFAFYKDRFGDAGDFTFVFVGNIDPAKLKPLVETYLASLPAHGRKEAGKDVGVRPPRGVKSKQVSLGAEPKSSVRIIFHGDDKWTRQNEMDADILSDVLRIRLREILREDMGGVYGVRAAGGISRRPVQRRTFSISFGCAPENVDKLKAAALTEIRRIAKEGIGDDYLDKLRQERVRSHETDLKNNRFWLAHLVEAYDYGDDPRKILELEPELARLTGANVKASAKHFLDEKQYITGVLLPAAAATAPVKGAATK